MTVATGTQALFKDTEEKMKKSLASLTREFSSIRGGRATPELVEHVTVEYYGTATPLKAVAAITAPEPNLLVIQPWDTKMVAEIEKGILKASIGINPVVEGKIVRLPIPPLTGERREELIKVIHKMAEEGRVNIRTIRRDANEAVKKLKTDKQVSEDESFKGMDQIQKLTDKYIANVDSLVKSKEQELHSV